MTISSRIFEAYLYCATKCWLLSRGEIGSNNAYAKWKREKNQVYRINITMRIFGNIQEGDYVATPSVNVNFKADLWKYAPDVTVKTRELESCIHAVERIPPDVQDKTSQYLPIRAVANDKLTKIDKLLIAFDAHILSETLKQEIKYGRIIHGIGFSSIKVKTSLLLGDVKNIVRKIQTLLTADLPPDLILNRHCQECDYQLSCREKANEKGDLSLLSSMTEKERKKFNSKGIFTVTQLSYTFRPRRRPKRLRHKREQYHHSLKALSIREKKIHIIGDPEFNIQGTPVYLDVEGLPDSEFYYLVGLRFRQSDSVVQHSFWADKPEDEKTTWRKLLDILSMIEQPVLVHYGSYESDYLKRMCERYGNHHQKLSVGETITKTVNLLSVLYAQIYFPVFSNGLKDIAEFLGYVWTDKDCSGLLSIMWRHRQKVGGAQPRRTSARERHHCERSNSHVQSY